MEVVVIVVVVVVVVVVVRGGTTLFFDRRTNAFFWSSCQLGAVSSAMISSWSTRREEHPPLPPWLRSVPRTSDARSIQRCHLGYVRFLEHPMQRASTVAILVTFESESIRCKEHPPLPPWLRSVPRASDHWCFLLVLVAGSAAANMIIVVMILVIMNHEDGDDDDENVENNQRVCWYFKVSAGNFASFPKLVREEAMYWQSDIRFRLSSTYRVPQSFGQKD